MPARSGQSSTTDPGRRSTALALIVLLLLSAMAGTVIGSPRARSFILALPQPEPHGNAATVSRPNLVLILTDDQRWDTLWAMPNVRHLLADHGVTFDNAFVTTSLCCPSRASILTGRYSRHTGVLDNSPPHGGAVAFHDGSTLATWLHGAGYTTALVGKYLNDYRLVGERYVPPGWDEWDAIAQQPMIKYYDYTLNQDGRLMSYGESPSDYSTTVLERRAVGFVAGVRSPFFLYFAPIAPHVPSTPAPRDLSRFSDLKPYRPASYNEPDASDKPWASQEPPLDPYRRASLDLVRRRMLESLQAVDRSVAAIVRAVAAKGQLENTDFVFMSDNGYLWGEHRLRDKIWPYEESIRAPLVIRTPWITKPVVDEHMALNIDIAPTLAQLAGVTPAGPVDGTSLLPLLKGESPSWRTAFVDEYLGRRLNQALPPAYEAIRTERYLYVEYVNGWRELYDLRKDPHELTNLADGSAAAPLRAQLAGRLRLLLAA